VREDEVAHQRRALLRHLAQHPPDRLLDEEPLLLEHRRGDLGEEREVAPAASERRELREERRPSNPEVSVLGPHAHARQQPRVPRDERVEDLRDQEVHVRPAWRRAHPIDEPRRVGRGEELALLR
jgi:hypothetical protein